MKFKLDDSLGFIINKVNTKLKNELFQRFREYDVTPEQWAVLNCLSEQEGITPKELSDIVFKDKPNTNRIVEKLQIKGLVVRKPHPVDKRAFQIFLTDDGWKLRDELIPKVMQLLEEATRKIKKHKVKEMKKLLNQIYNNLN
ncbi:MarR family transcriptional regulator [Clostridium tyrobutyricum]|jgi:DNA-binding MarR family transcriptional regulator|uniref:MarR family winged helix-turn-helix transcriptional regulator n=1 Tax=Clostridium tyrobutyricum TaxID=1519 RepID=UPI00073D39F1|nr:MarR family transcriptional regulator [Clostridium tyrobutyricum]MBR9649041.1 MarR family transcriptional regulator [Clostridium tyrobutyricum]MBV4419241.1 MarR family transcriptional regulator [Clostridium tyrobutyricum]MBV4429567.1 MarR family transcriptional regulator [Clostridium tyrobutyricum]MBV4444801.1 MarR family transcriptional regulator [Clostridium tyrobutyricum]MBV4447624.1 MarR family transcriptional regulator [Clostridium tyrobutyricum]